MQLLFESRPEILCARGDVHFFQASPQMTEEPVLVGDSFVDRRGITMYGSILYDQGVYRCWYRALYDPAYGAHFDTCLVGYAESDDGVAWRKPKLGMVDCGGTDNNLCDLGLNSPSVMIDPDAAPERRYVATGYLEKRYQGYHRDARPEFRGYYTAYSADGLHWFLDSPDPVWPGGDDIASVYHPGRRQIQTLMKVNGFRAGVMHRIFWETKRDADGWAEPRQTLVPDEFADIAAQARGANLGDYNNMGLLPAGRATVMFLESHRSRLPWRGHPRGRGYGFLGNLDLTLAYQNDEGHAWLFPAGRPDWVRRGSVDWARSTMFCCSNTVSFGDEQRLYITGRNISHGAGTSDQNDSPFTSYFNDRVGYAYWPKWRLFGCRADPEGVLTLNLGPQARPCEALLNYETEAGGSIRVDWLHRGRFDREQDGVEIEKDAAVLDGSELEKVLHRRDGAPLEVPDGRELAMRLTMNRATVYAWDTRPA